MENDLTGINDLALVLMAPVAARHLGLFVFFRLLDVTSDTEPVRGLGVGNSPVIALP
jgi:hypothetical protein